MAKTLKENFSIKKNDLKDKIYCQEPYAQELYNLICKIPVPTKDVSEGQLLDVIDLKITSSNNVEILTSTGIGFFLDMRKEKKYFEAIGFEEFDVDNIRELSATGWFRDTFKERGEKIKVEGRPSEQRGSMYEAYLNRTRNEFIEQIKDQNAYYVAKVISKNQGGFFVKVQGVDAFLPGSLAAANKIVDFETYIGKEVPVMVEDYLKQSDTFIFSYKKYLDKILPSKLANIEKNSFLTGIITGSSKYGIFVEFEDIFTGLLHTTEMCTSTLEMFNKRLVHAGEEIQVWVKDIKDNKLILSENNPADKMDEMNTFKTKTEGLVKSMKVISVKPFGAFFEVEENRIGLLPIREMKKVGKRIEVGDIYELCISKVDSDSGKIYLTALNEKTTA